VGDIETQTGFITIPEDASVATVLGFRHRTNAMQAIMTGGFKQGMPSKQVIALAFDMIK